MAPRKQNQPAQPAATADHADGWQNVMTGLGTKKSDKTAHTNFGGFGILADTELASIYSGEGIGATIVDCVPEDATKNGFTIPGDQDGEIEKDLNRVKAVPSLAQAMKWARLFGGALVVMDIADGLPWDQPYRPGTKPAPLRSLRVYARTRVELNPGNMVVDPQSPYFENFERFTIRKLYGGTFQVHASRCLIFKGIQAPDIIADYLSFDHRFWGLSVLQRVYTHLSNLGAMLQGLGVLGQEFSIGKLRLSNLSRLVAENNWKAIDKRMEAIALQKGIIKTILLGENEEFSRDNLGGNGLDSITDRLFDALATAARIPRAVLFGKDGGLNSNQEEDTRRYYDSVKNYQTNDAEPALLQLAKVSNAALGLVVPEDELSVEWNAPWVMSETQMVQNREKQANIDKAYIEAGVYTADDVARSRFSGGYSYETTIEGIEGQ